MKKKFKQALASFLIVLMALTSMPLGNFILPELTAKAADEPTPESCFTYTVTNGEATITKFDNSVADVVIPETLGGYPVVVIGKSSFANCDLLKSVIISYGVKKIYDHAFISCKNLESIILSNSIEYIGGSAIIACDSLKNINIPYSVKTIASRALSCNSLQFITVDSENPNYSNDENGVLFNKNKTVLKQYPIGRESDSYIVPNTVTEIDFAAFENCEKIRSIELQDSVKNIDAFAFCNCDSLDSINIPNSVISIDAGAFGDSDSLKRINIPNSVVSMGRSGFSECDSLQAVTVDSKNPNYSSDENGVLFNKEKTVLLEYPGGRINDSYTIPNSVQEIGRYSFYNCQTIKNVVMPNGVVDIAVYAFCSCSNLTDINIPSTVKNIGDHAFWSCRKLENVVIPEGVTTIESSAFSGCYSFTFVEIPDSVINLGKWAFFSCINIKEVVIGDGVTVLDTVFDGCRGLRDVTIGKGVVTLKDEFASCSNLEEIVIPENVEKFSGEMFESDYNLQSVEILNPNLDYSECCSFNRNTFDPLTFYCHYNSTTEKFVAGEQYLKFDHLRPYPVKETVEPSCFEDGKIVYDCDQCSFNKEEVLPAIGSHNHVLTETVAPSCGVEGKNVYTCSRCDDTYEEAVPALEHSYALTETVEAMCTEDGKKVYTCTNCGDTYEEAIPATGHNYVLTETVEPTCTEDGKKVYTCSNCSDTYEEIIPALGEHEYTLTDTVNPTCTENGKKVYVCSHCEDKYEEAIPAIGHNYAITETVEPSCTENGKKVYTCANCNDSYEELIPATGHSFGEWVIETEATPFREGLKKRTCSVCSFEETEVIPRIPCNDVADDSSGVHVIFPDHGFDDDINVIANHVDDNSELYDKIQELGYDRVEVYDVNVYLEDGTPTQPNGKVWVKIPAPDTFNEKNCSAYYIPPNGKPQRVKSFYQDGYIYIETDHFSVYAIVDESSKASPLDNFTITNNGKNVHQGSVVNVKVSPFGAYNKASTVLGVKPNDNVQIKSVRYELANWSAGNPEANITENGDGTATITPNGRGIGGRSVWVRVTVEDYYGNTVSQTVKVRFYKWNWQMQ